MTFALALAAYLIASPVVAFAIAAAMPPRCNHSRGWKARVLVADRREAA